MGIYANDIETLLTNFNGVENILHRYDNVTYHIEFFMVFQKNLKKYLTEKSHLFSTYYLKAITEQKAIDIDGREQVMHIEPPKSAEELMIELWNLQNILEQQKIIIAESGKTAETSIESLSMTTHTPTSSITEMLTTTEFEMTIKEINSAVLVNKISFGSLISGYDTYVSQPYFINVWFSGYEHETGRPVEKIPLLHLSDDIIMDKLTYQVIIASVKSSSESSSTTHNMKLYINSGLINTKESKIGDLGSIILKSDNKLGDAFKILETKLNEKARKTYSEYVMNHIYKDSSDNKNPVYKIYFSNIPNDTILGTRTNTRYEKGRQFNNLMDLREKTSNEIEALKEKDKKSRLTNEEKERLDAYEYKLEIIDDLTKIKVDDFLNYTNEEKEISIGENDTVVTFIRKLLDEYSSISSEGYVLIPKVITYYVGTFDGKNYYRYDIAIHFQFFPELKNDIDRNTNENKKKRKLYKEEQREYVNSLIKDNMLNKKYYWNNSGRNTEVLSIKKEENLMWYLNSCILDDVDVEENETNNTTMTNTVNENLMYKPYNSLSTSLTENAFQEWFEKKRISDHNNGIYYLDDVFRQATNFYQNDINSKKWQSLAKSNKSLFASTLSNTKVNNDSKDEKTSKNDEQRREFYKRQNRVKIGLENVFQTTGHKVKLEMDILGDPYWLMGNLMYNDTNECVGMYQPHLVLMQRGPLVVDNNDDYIEDKFNNFNTIYNVIKVVSILNGGKFTQRVTGYVPTSFLQSSKYEDDLVEITKTEETNTNKASDVNELLDGSINSESK